MTPVLKRIVFIVLALALLILTGFYLYRHFVTNQIMDGGGGMENPNAIQVLDGDHTYVNNSILWPVLEGVWDSGDGRWQAVIGQESGITLRMDGETLLNGALYFTYLQPGKILQTELSLDKYTLCASDGTNLGEITYFCHETADGGSGTLRMELAFPDDTEKMIKLQKIKE